MRLLTVTSAVGATPPLFSTAVDGADVRLEGAHAAVDGRDRASERVEGGRGQRQRELRVPGAHQRHSPHDQGPPAPGAPGGQHHPHGNHARAHLRRLFESGGGRAVPEQQQLRAARRQVLRSESVGGRGQWPLPPRPGPVHAPDHPQPALPVAPHRGRHPGQRQRHRDRGGLLEHARPRATEVARVRLRLGQEARAGDGVVDLCLGSPRRPVLGEGRCQQRIQLGPRVIREQLVGHVALRLGLREVIREIHVSQGVCDLLVDFGPGVEVEQRGDDLGIDLAAVVVAGQGRGDGRGHRAARGVVGQLARHVGRDLRLVPEGRQGRGDEGLHLRFVLELGQVQGVDGGGDRCARLQLRVGFAPGVAVRLDEDRVVQVLEAGGQGAGHGQVAQHVAAPQQVERGPAGPALAVAQRDGRQRRRDGCVPLGRSPEGHQRRRDCGVRLSGVVKTRKGCRDGGVSLGRRFEGHQRIGDGLVHLDRRAVALGLIDGRHHGHGNFGAGEVVRQRGADGVIRSLGAVRIAAEAQGPVVVGELDAQGARCVQVADLVGAGQQVPGHVADPSGGVDQVGGGFEGGDFRQDPVDGGLQGDLQVAEVPCRGEGPGVLEG